MIFAAIWSNFCCLNASRLNNTKVPYSFKYSLKVVAGSQVHLKLTYKNTVIFLSLYFAGDSAVFLDYFQFYHTDSVYADLLAPAQYVINILCFLFFYNHKGAL